jgi:hypothetical protein
VRSAFGAPFRRLTAARSAQGPPSASEALGGCCGARGARANARDCGAGLRDRQRLSARRWSGARRRVRGACDGSVCVTRIRITARHCWSSF